MTKSLGSRGEKKPFKCETCDYRCFLKHNMKSHIMSVHEEKKPFGCEICDYRCSQKGHLKSQLFMGKRNQLFSKKQYEESCYKSS